MMIKGLTRFALISRWGSQRQRCGGRWQGLDFRRYWEPLWRWFWRWFSANRSLSWVPAWGFLQSQGKTQCREQEHDNNCIWQHHSSTRSNTRWLLFPPPVVLKSFVNNHRPPVMGPCRSFLHVTNSSELCQFSRWSGAHWELLNTGQVPQPVPTPTVRFPNSQEGQVPQPVPPPTGPIFPSAHFIRRLTRGESP